MITDKEIGEKADKHRVRFVRSDCFSELHLKTSFIDGAQWLRSELRKRSEQSFEEFYDSGIVTQDDLRVTEPMTSEQRLRYYCQKSWQAAQFSQAATVEQLREEFKEARILAEMVQDNTKMPHQHTDPQLRLYCLAERAAEFLAKYPEAKP